MAHVIVLDSVNEDIFVCGLCKSVFNSLELFLEHKRIKCATENLECITNENIVTDISSTCYSGVTALSHQTESVEQGECNYSAETSCETKTNETTCSICRKKFKKRKGLLAHTKSHYLKPHQCLVCGRCFIQNSHLQRHKSSHKVWPQSLSETTPKCINVEPLSYSCPYCETVFSNYNQFRSHLKNHQSYKKFKCIQGDCKDFYDTYEMLLHHVASSHITQVYTCHICSEPFDSLESIARHELSHNDFGKHSVQVKHYKCAQCDAIFTKPERLSLHMLTENHNKVCIHCKKAFASDKRLRLHLQIHRHLKPFQCHICSKSFHMKKYLSSHILKHGNKEFKCSICKCTFSRSDILQRHMRSRHSLKRFVCPYKDTLNCKREFSRKDKLKLHLQSHSCKLGDTVQINANTNNVDKATSSNTEN